MTTFIMPTAPTTQTITPPSQNAYTASPTHYTHGPSPAQAPPQTQSQPQYKHFFTSHATPVSPLTSTTTSPNNASPTSPRTVHSSQQISTQQASAAPLQQQHLVRNLQLRPPKSPLYVPAVLRPTEPPRGKRIVKPSPMTPPRSAGSSFDDLNGQGAGGNVQGVDMKGRPLSRRSTVDSGKWVGDRGKEVTRSHWLPDTSSPTCTSATCDRSFSFYTRRHHCRRCGHIFCSTHSSQTVPLDCDANFDNQDGTAVRACEGCFDEFCAWETAREERSRSNSESSEDLVPQSPAVAVGGMKSGKGALKGVMGQEMGQSVPRDWSWSTF